jgi:hypothetical protein
VSGNTVAAKPFSRDPKGERVSLAAYAHLLTLKS